jgi:hypothetical protein
MSPATSKAKASQIKPTGVKRKAAAVAAPVPSPRADPLCSRGKTPRQTRSAYKIAVSRRNDAQRAAYEAQRSEQDRAIDLAEAAEAEADDNETFREDVASGHVRFILGHVDRDTDDDDVVDDDDAAGGERAKGAPDVSRRRYKVQTRMQSFKLYPHWAVKDTLALANYQRSVLDNPYRR